MRTNIKSLTIAFLLLSVSLPAAGPAYAAPLYFPHVATGIPWQTEIAIINTSPDRSVTGILRAFDDDGQPAEIKNVALKSRSRLQINVAGRFRNHTNIRYIVFDTDSDTVQGYTKFYREGCCRAAIPAVKEVNATYIRIPHISSDAAWWTGLGLVNTTTAVKRLAVVGNNRQGREFTLDASGHRAFDIESLFDNQPQPDIQAGWITNAAGMVGLELFGNEADGNRLDGALLTDRIASTLYIPHVAGDGWRTDIAIYNPLFETNTITITPYSEGGTQLAPTTRSLEALEKFIGTISDLGLPAETAWLRIDAMRGITGLEILGTANGEAIAAYTGTEADAAKEGVFPKIERNGWTGIALVNTEDDEASVTLTALDDHGAAVATRALTIGGHAKTVSAAEALFSEGIGGATYMAYASDRELVGLQLNGSSDGTMLDALPALVQGGPPAPVWQQIAGPEGGDINCIAVAPTDTMTVYAGVNGGGVFKTTDGGSSWKSVNAGITTYYIRSIAVDPQDHRIVYAGTDGGIFRTTDGGSSWTAMNTGLANTRVSSIAIDPGNSRVVYVGITGSGGAGTGGGVYKTIDGGASWTAMNAGLASTRVTCLTLDSANSQTLYTGTWAAISQGTDGKITSVGGGVYKTTDGGASWTKMEIDTGSAYTVITTTLAIDPKNSRTVYAVVGTTIYKTTNGGASWTALNTAAITTGITALAIDQANSKTIYAGTGGAFGCAGGYNGGGCGPDIPGAVFKTVNGGKTWTTFKTGNANDSIHSLAVDPSKSGAVYVGTNNNGVFKTTDGGVSWTAINTGTVGDVESFAIDPADSRILYAGAWGGGGAGRGGVFKTTNGGASWTAVNTGLTNNNVQTLAIDPANRRIVYAGTFFGGVFKTTDGGASWRAVNTGMSQMIINSLAIDPTDSRIVYAGTDYTEPGNPGGGPYVKADGDAAGNGGVFKTIDGGASWTALDGGIPGTRISSLTIDPVNSQIVYAGTPRGIYKTADGGASWMAINTGLTNIYVSSLAIDPSNSQIVYAGTGGGGVFKTIDGGASWTAINTGITNTNILSLAIDPTDSRTVYAGNLSGGIFRTTNGGASWKAVNAGLTNNLIYSIAIDPANSGIVYAGTGGGVFKMGREAVSSD